MASWNQYYEGLTELQNKGFIELASIPEECTHNAHMFYIKVRDFDSRTELLKYLRQNSIGAVFHYVPLHSAPAGLDFGRFYGNDKYKIMNLKCKISYMHKHFIAQRLLT